MSFIAHMMRLSADFARLIVFSFRLRVSVEAENLLLRCQLARYRERGVKPRRVDPATWASQAFISQFFDSRSALVVVRPETMVRWHRAGRKLLWRLKSRPGRPPLLCELRHLIRRMAIDIHINKCDRFVALVHSKFDWYTFKRTDQKAADRLLSGRPRKTLGWDTPDEALVKKMEIYSKRVALDS